MFSRDHQLAVMPAQVEKRIDPGIKIRGAAETVTGTAVGSDILACVVDQRDRRYSFALQNPQIAEQGGDLACRVFIDRVKSDQGIENEKSGPMKHERGFQTLLIG